MQRPWNPEDGAGGPAGHYFHSYFRSHTVIRLELILIAELVLLLSVSDREQCTVHGLRWLPLVVTWIRIRKVPKLSTESGSSSEILFIYSMGTLYRNKSKSIDSLEPELFATIYLTFSLSKTYILNYR